MNPEDLVGPGLVVIAAIVLFLYAVIGEAVIHRLDPENHWADKVFRLGGGR